MARLAGEGLYLVGGASRALARLHMEHAAYPLHIVHQYTMARGEAESFFEVIGRQSRKSLERITTIPRKRLEMVPIAASILRKLVALIGTAAHRILRVRAARGLRLWAGSRGRELDADPLIAACKAIAQSQSRFSPDGDFLQQWTAPLFRNCRSGARRLHRAACWLGDVAWSEHPDYRAVLAFARSLRMPYPAATHADRVFIASALHARYAGRADDPIKAATATCSTSGPGRGAHARAGVAARLHTLWRRHTPVVRGVAAA